ncbi:WD40 repeat-like protein [Coccomyxa subellipsoidea C-169]|uniref:WD40 repeat-like protein n=1 Tax=Coccomyxa subellipsoidea (strain C-169) TaxID=574566 RepID=I0Z4B3_COCSC|nr:WD40 repeat-like protein [Coccomyxa subellipsoidea C-169]EIE25482.1 WD40 repeat-like protein [Coccomyxa subellipsoidea C-169]|eukprot:XP_005650026.1 WD40 repeat-like protein [Coccomyxa subellipsoidea C-169]
MQASRHAQILQEEAVRQMELRRRMRAAVVPTQDAEVRRTLRLLKEPVTLFGEREMERRDRLRKLLAEMDDDEKLDKLGGAEPEDVDMVEIRKEKFYTEGPPQLKAARMHLAHWSLERAMDRINFSKRKRESPDEDELSERKAAVDAAKGVVNQSSEIGDDRPITACAFSPSGQQLATAALSGLLKLWTVPDCQKQITIKAHADRVTGVAWHPHAGAPGQGEDAPALVTGGVDTTARLWSASGKQLRTLAGHADRLGRVAVHPMGQHLGTASFDQTWRLWDLETGDCLLEQEGHSRSVYTVAFQGDGALAASGGLDAIGRLWDLRSGNSIMVLEGHVRGILSMDFSPNGYQLVSGSEDHTAKVWDLRKRKALYTLPGHTSLVSQVRYEPCDGYYLLTAGYDNTAKLWSSDNFKLIATLAGHEGRVIGADISPDGSGLIASVSADRTIKLWASGLL